MADFDELVEEYEVFLEKRDWEKFHTPKNVAESISIEANELLEVFQWQGNVEGERIKDDEEMVDEVRDELADVLIYCMSMSIQLDINLEEAVEEKMKINEERFDLERSREIREKHEKWQ